VAEPGICGWNSGPRGPPVKGGPWTSLSWPPVPGGLVVGTFYSLQLALVGEDASHGPCGRGHEVVRPSGLRLPITSVGGASERRATVPSSTEHQLDATRIAGHERSSAALRSHEGRKFLHF